MHARRPTDVGYCLHRPEPMLAASCARDCQRQSVSAESRLDAVSPPAETVFWKKPGARPSGKKRGMVLAQLRPKGPGNAPAFLPEGAEIGFLCCPVWQGKLLKTQITIFADR